MTYWILSAAPLVDSMTCVTHDVSPYLLMVSPPGCNRIVACLTMHVLGFQYQHVQLCVQHAHAACTHEFRHGAICLA